MKVINEFEHEGKTMQVFEDLSVKEKTEKPAPGKHLLKDVIHLLKAGDKFMVEFTVDRVNDAYAFASADGEAGNHSVYLPTIITIPGEPERETLLVCQLTEDDIEKEFMVIKGADSHDISSQGHTFTVRSLELACHESFADIRFTDGYEGVNELHAETIIRRIS